MTCHDNSFNRRKILDIRIGRLVEAHVVVTDLQKGEMLLLRGRCLADRKSPSRPAQSERPKCANCGDRCENKNNHASPENPTRNGCVPRVRRFVIDDLSRA
jgi:hypothetical protein